MRCENLKNRLVYTFLLLPLWMGAQNISDCNGAIVVCGDTNIDVPDSPGDVFDFDDPDNDIGCHETGETSSVWLYFRFISDMPAGSELRFTIDPYEGTAIDYDFALYAANTRCDSLGEPDRCSYAWSVEQTQTFQCGFCPFTGLGNGETDVSEGIFFDETGAQANGYVAPIIVNPGEGFYLYINEFYGVSGEESASDGFNITFSGEAANYFDCTANPNCDLQVVTLDQDTALCSGNVPFVLNSEVTYATGFEIYTWTAADGAEVYLDDPSSPAPELTFPPDFSGTVEFFLEVSSDGCVNHDTLNITVEPSPPITVGFEEYFCEGDSLTLDAGPGFATYAWSDGTADQTILADTSGMYSVTVTAPGNGCEIIRDVAVTEVPTPTPAVAGGPYLCEGDTDTLAVEGSFAAYNWVGFSNDSFLVVNQPGNYLLRVTDTYGCEGDTSVSITEIPAQQPGLVTPPGLCPDGEATLSLSESWAGYQWTGGSADSLLVVDTAGLYSVTVTDTFGCAYTAASAIEEVPAPTPVVSGDTAFCDGGNSLFLTVQNYDAYLWSTGDTTSMAVVDEGGEYFVTVTAANGCTGVDTFEVTEYAPLAVDVAIVNQESLCAGDTVYAFVDQTYINYSWNTGGVGPLTPIAQPGLYTVTVTDDRGCTGIDSVAVAEFQPPSPVIEGPAGLCPEESGELTVGNYPAIDWGGGAFDDTLSISAPGWYTVTVEDENGCLGTDSMEVVAYTAPQPSLAGDTSLCEQGTVNLTLTETYTSYDWSDNTNGPSLEVAAAGEYSVTVTSTEGCTGVAAATVAAFPNPALDLPDASAYCANSSVTLSAGQAYDGYSWSTGATGPAITVDSAAVYVLTVFNEFGCTATDSIAVAEETVPESGLQGPYAFCETDSITIVAAPGYEAYAWSATAVDNALTVSEEGMYYVTITANNGCVAVDSAYAQPVALPAPAITGGPQLCAGNTLELQVDAAYTSYEWQDGSTANSLSIGQPGLYTLEVTNAAGCAGRDSILVEEVPLPDAGLPSDAAYCAGGSVLVEAQAGFPEYEWSTGAQSAGIEVNAPGIYTLTVTDANQCQDSFSLAVLENPLPVITLQGDLEYCAGETTTLSIAEHHYPFVTWSNADEDTEATFSNPGPHQVTVLDSNGCVANLPFTLVENPLPEVEVDGPGQFCEGQSIALTGTPGYENYNWSTGGSADSIMVDSAGTYALTVTDAKGCQNTAAVDLAVSPLPEIALPDSTQFCEDESVFVGVEALPGHVYSWSNGPASPGIDIGLPGSYTLSVATPDGCVDSAAVEVLEIPEPNVVVSGDLTLCPGDSSQLSIQDSYSNYQWSTGDTLETITVANSGFYQVTVVNQSGCVGTSNIFVQDVAGTTVDIGGVVPFCEGDSIYLEAGNYSTYLWSDGSNAATLPVSQSGQYALTVTNAQGCEARDSVAINALPRPEPNIPAYVSGCNGEDFWLEPAAGTFAAYQWSTGAQTAAINVSESGIYTLTVEDENGCVASDSTEVFIRPTPDLNLTEAQNICMGSSTTLGVEGDWATINWSTGATTPSITVSEAGGYGVVVTDSLGCVANAVTAVFVFAVDPPAIEGDTGYCPNGTAVFAAEEGFATYQWSNGMTSREIAVAEEGVYTVTVQDTVGCMNSASWEVKPYAAPTIEISGEDLLCEGSANALNVSTNGHFLGWSTGDTTLDIQVLEPGLYTAQAEGDNSCVSTDTVEVQQAGLPVAPAGADQALDCDTRSVTLGPGSPPAGELAFVWQGPGITPANQTDPNPVVGQPGVYGLLVTDMQTGCVSSLESVEVTDLSYLPVASVSVEDTLDCNTPTVTLSGHGSENGPAIVYQWLGADGAPFPGEQADTFVADALGGYQLMVTDTATGCTAFEEVEVAGDFDIPTVIINPNVDPLTCERDSVRLSAVASAPYGPPVLQWSARNQGPLPGETGLHYTTATPGYFFLTATDPVNGCQAADSVQVSIDTIRPVAVLSASGQLDCQNEAVTIDATGSSQGSPFVYDWAGPGVDNELQGMTVAADRPGVYQLTVLNPLNGCSAMAQVNVEEAANTLSAAEVETIDPICYEEENGQIRVVEVNGGTPPYLYSLNGAPFGMSRHFTGLGSGAYTIRIQDLEGCEYETAVTLEDGRLPQLTLGPDRDIRLGEEVLLNALTNLISEEWVRIEWAPEDSLACDQCLFWVDAPEKTTRYRATIQDTSGCTATDEMLVKVIRDYQVYIPNAFTPNGDGFNDFFMIFGGSDVAKIHKFEIYTRWGEPVYQAVDFQPNNPAYGWDGTFRGQPMNISYFTYYAKVEYVDGEVVLFEGGAHLIR